MTRELPPENAWRGLRFALLTVPPVVIALTFIWDIPLFLVDLGLEALLGLAIGAGVVLLYRLGSRGRIGRRGLAVIGVVLVVTMPVEYVLASLVDQSIFLAENDSLTFFEAFISRQTWALLPQYWVANNSILSIEFVIAFAVAVGGAFMIARELFTEGQIGELRYEDLEYDI